MDQIVHGSLAKGPLSPLMKQLLKQIAVEKKAGATSSSPPSQSSSVLRAENNPRLRERVSHKLQSYDRMQMGRHLDIYGRSPARSSQGAHHSQRARESRQNPLDRQYNSFSEARTRKSKIPEDLRHVMEPDDIFATQSREDPDTPVKVTSLTFDRHDYEQQPPQVNTRQHDRVCRLTQIMEIEQDHISERKAESGLAGERESFKDPREQEVQIASVMRRQGLVNGSDVQPHRGQQVPPGYAIDQSAPSQGRRQARSPLASDHGHDEYMSLSKKSKQQRMGRQNSQTRKPTLPKNGKNPELDAADGEQKERTANEVPQWTREGVQSQLRDQTRTKTVSETSGQHLLARGEAIGQELLVMDAGDLAQALYGDEALGPEQVAAQAGAHAQFSLLSRSFDQAQSYQGDTGQNVSRSPSRDDDGIVIHQSNSKLQEGQKSEKGASGAPKFQAVRLKRAGEAGLRKMNAQHIIQSNINAMSDQTQNQASDALADMLEEERERAELEHKIQSLLIEQSRRREAHGAQFQPLEVRHFGFDQIKRRFGVFYSQHLSPANMRPPLRTPTSTAAPPHPGRIVKEVLPAQNPTERRQPPQFENLHLPTPMQGSKSQSRSTLQPSGPAKVNTTRTNSRKVSLNASRSKEKLNRVVAQQKLTAPKNSLRDLGKQIYNDRMLIRKRMEEASIRQLTQQLQSRERHMQLQIKQSLEGHSVGSLASAPGTPARNQQRVRERPQILSLDAQTFRSPRQQQARDSRPPQTGAEAVQAIHTHDATRDCDSKETLGSTFSAKSIRSPAGGETADGLRPWKDNSESTDDDAHKEKQLQPTLQTVSQTAKDVPLLKPALRKDTAHILQSFQQKHVTIQASNQTSNPQSLIKPEPPLNDKQSQKDLQQTESKSKVNTGTAKRVQVDELLLERALENQKLQLQLQMQQVNRKKLVLQQERPHSIYVKSKQFKVLGGRTIQRLEKQAPSSIRLSVNVDPLLDRKHDLFQRSKEAVAVAGTKIAQKDRYADLVKEQLQSPGSSRQPTAKNPKRGDQTAKAVKGKVQLFNETRLKEDGSQTGDEHDGFREELTPGNATGLNASPRPLSSMYRPDIEQNGDGQEQSKAKPSMPHDSLEDGKPPAKVNLKFKRSGSKVSKLLKKGPRLEKPTEPSRRSLLDQLQDASAQRQASRQQVLSKVNNVTQFREHVQMLRGDNQAGKDQRLSESKAQQLQMLRHLSNQIKEDQENKARVQTIEVSFSKQSLPGYQEAYKVKSTRAMNPTLSRRVLNFQQLLNHGSPEHITQALLQNSSSADKSQRFQVNYLSKRAGGLQSLPADRDHDQQPQGVDGKSINIRTLEKAMKGGMAVIGTPQPVETPRVELTVPGPQGQPMQVSGQADLEEGVSPKLVDTEEVGTSPLIKAHQLSATESPLKASECSLNGDVAPGFNLSPEKVRSIPTTQMGSVSDGIAPGELSGLPRHLKLNLTTLKPAGPEPKDKHINFQNLDITTPKESLRNQQAFSNLKDQVKRRSKDKQKSVAFEQPLELRKVEAAPEDKEEVHDGQKSPFKNAKIDRELAANHDGFRYRNPEEVQIDGPNMQKDRIHESVAAATPGGHTPSHAFVAATQAQMQIGMGVAGYKARRQVLEQEKKDRRKAQNQERSNGTALREDGMTPGQLKSIGSRGPEMRVVSNKIQLETPKGTYAQKKATEIRAKMPTEMHYKGAQRTPKMASMAGNGRRPLQTDTSREYFAQIPGQGLVHSRSPPRRPLDNMNSDSILSSMVHLRKQYQTIDRNVSQTVNRAALPRNDEGGRMLPAPVSRSLAKPKLRLPGLSETQSYESAMTNDINEATRQQQRIQDVIQQQSARRYQNALSLSLEHAPSLEPPREAPTIRVQNVNRNPSHGGQKPTALATISPKKQPQQKNFRNQKRHRIQVFASVDQMGNHPNKRLDNIVEGKIKGWDTTLKDDDTVIIQIQGAKLLNESNIREMNNVAAHQPLHCEPEGPTQPSKLERMVKVQVQKKRPTADDYRGQQQLTSERGLQAGAGDSNLQLPGSPSASAMDRTESPESRPNSTSRQAKEHLLNNVNIENSLQVNIIKPKPSPMSLRKMSEARKKKEQEALELGKQSGLTVNMNTCNADLKQMTAYRDSGEEDSMMTNQFGQTLVKMGRATPLSPTLRVDYKSKEQDHQQIPQVTKVKIQNTVPNTVSQSPMNMSPKSKHRLAGCLPPLTESVHSFYKDTTFNSFRNIPNTTGSIQGGEIARVFTQHSQELGGVQGVGIAHEYVKEVEKPTKIVVNYGKEAKEGATSLQSKRKNNTNAVDPRRAIATSLEMSYDAFKYENEGFTLQAVPRDQVDRASMVNLGTVSGRSPSSYYQKETLHNAFLKTREAVATGSFTKSKQNSKKNDTIW